jgi:DNA repair exonuclease SbcCD ATPase subunit
MRHSIGRIVPFALLAAAGVLGFSMASRAGGAAATAPAASPATISSDKGAPQPITLPVDHPGGAANTDLKALDDQIKTLREQFHAQIDPLEAEIKAAREKFEPQLKTLEDQRRALVEQRESPALRELDEQETGELASLGEQEKAELDRVRQRFAEQKKEIQQRYQQRRHELQSVKK